MPPGRYVVAVSGGVDSVVLLDMLMRGNQFAAPDYKFIVAHFDHGIRDDSSEDAGFVAELAKKYGLEFASRRETLGSGVSEELARTRRYTFLRSVANQNHAKLVTAHHADDVVESVTINLQRGTGWRGLAVMDSDVVRPLLDIDKQLILDYARRYHLIWHEDSTNASDAYLRNRIRRRAHDLADDAKRQVIALRSHQVGLKAQINQEVVDLVGTGPEYSRYFFTHINQTVALECLRYIVHARLTRPQLGRALLAIKTAKPHVIYEAGDGVEFRFTSRNFVVKLIK